MKLKLNPVRGMLEGKRVVLVDDSIVRGTTSRKIVRLVREAGATEVHMRISCPPTISPCYYGVDTPTREELIAADESRETPAAHAGGIRSVRTASSTRASARSRKSGDIWAPIRWAMFRWKICAARSDDTRGTFCTSCYTGVYPVDGAQAELDPRAAESEESPGRGNSGGAK